MMTPITENEYVGGMRERSEISSMAGMFGRISRLEQEVSGIDATLRGQAEMLREIRNEQMRPKPATNWIGVLTVALALVGGGAVYVNTQTDPMRSDIKYLLNNSDELVRQQAMDAADIRWLRKLEERAYDERVSLRVAVREARGGK